VAYLNVQKIRMGARLAVDVDVPRALHALPVPPMMLSTLAENAVIHGVGPMPGGGKVTISARRAGERLVVAVSDDGRGFQSTWGAGVGLANIRARLESEFGAAAALELRPDGERGVTASISLPAGAAGAAR
jgi:LytS/YehU family sensor histidine kinase